MIETFDITIMDKYNNIKKLATLDANDDKCPLGYSLYEDSEANGLNRVYSSCNIFYSRTNSLQNNRYYCLDAGHVEKARTSNAPYLIDYIGGALCPNYTFEYHGKCINTDLPKYENDLTSCMASSIHDQQSKCPEITHDIPSLVYKLGQLPLPNHSNIVRNRIGGEKYYCPASHPVLIKDNAFTGRLCADTETFGLIFNRYCDTQQSVGTSCMLREKAEKESTTYPQVNYYKMLEKTNDKLDTLNTTTDNLKWAPYALAHTNLRQLHVAQETLDKLRAIDFQPEVHVHTQSNKHELDNLTRKLGDIHSAINDINDIILTRRNTYGSTGQLQAMNKKLSSLNTTLEEINESTSYMKWAPVMIAASAKQQVEETKNVVAQTKRAVDELIKNRNELTKNRQVNKDVVEYEMGNVKKVLQEANELQEANINHVDYLVKRLSTKNII